MKISELKKIMKEVVKESINESLKDILLEAIKQPQPNHNVNLDNTSQNKTTLPQNNTSKRNITPSEYKKEMDKIFEGLSNPKSPLAGEFIPNGDPSPNGRLPDGELTLEQITNLMGKK